MLGAAGLLALFAAFPPSAKADMDCPDFSSQAAAQQYFEANGGSPSNNFDLLDADGDGIACEDNPCFCATSGGGGSGGGGGGKPDRPHAERIRARVIDVTDGDTLKVRAFGARRFGGLRIGEALALRWRDVDLAGARMQVTAAKTDAGVRRVDLVPALRDELAAHKAHQSRGGRSVNLSDRVFGTEAGNAQNPSNVRNRVLARAVERANERREQDEKHPLPEGLTPHSLRKTFISVLFALGEDTPYIMGQVGHRDPKVTLGIYAEVMRRGDAERESLRALVGAGEWAQMGTNHPESNREQDRRTHAEAEETA